MSDPAPRFQPSIALLPASPAQINSRAVIECPFDGPVFTGADREVFGCSGCGKPLLLGVSIAAFAATFPHERGAVVHCGCGAYSVLPA